MDEHKINILDLSIFRYLFSGIMFSLDVKGLARSFGPRKIFEDIDFSLKSGDSMAIVGHNGSGKTTLLKTLLGFLVPTKGEIVYSQDDKVLEFEQYRKRISLVAPYLAMYDVLTGKENLQFLTKIDGCVASDNDITAMLVKVGLRGRGDDMVGAYSTGMKQRLKYALAILKQPDLYIFDEPTANLDDDGKKIVFDLIDEQKQTGIVILATNEKEEYGLAEQLCKLGD